MERMLYSIVGNHNITVKNQKPFTVYKLMTGISTELVKNKMGTVDFSKLTSNLAQNPLRNAFIVDLIEKNTQHKIMLLTWSKAHVQTLYEALKLRGVSVDYLSGTKSKYVDSRVLLGTISKVSTGFDSKNVAIDFDGMAISMMIFLASTKSFNLHIQSIGRAFRSDNPVVIDFVDENRISKSHWNARHKNYKEMNCTIHEIEMKKQQPVSEMQSSHLSRYREKYANLTE
jgi:superfamily II DNA or RNA helicase